MSWTNLCVEAFCGGEIKNGVYPCGRDCPSHLCLENGLCPFFAYAETTEREVAQFPPLRFILKDRLRIWGEDLYWKFRWWFWDSLWFNRRKMQKFFNSIKSVSSKECPALAEYEDEQRECKRKFVEWFEKVKHDISPYNKES